MIEPALVDTFDELGELAAAADKEKANALVAPQALRGGEHSGKLVHPPEIPRIANNEPVPEPPFAPQRIVEWCQRPDFLVVAPVWYDPDPFRRDVARAEDLGHGFPHYHIGRGCAQ